MILPISPRAMTLAVFVSCLAVSSVVRAEPPAPEQIPDVLEPWIPWVLDDVGDEQCPNVQGVRTCVWPSALELSVTAQGASFTLRVTTDRKIDVALPGAVERWPLDVRVDGQAAPVVEPHGWPEVRLLPGAHVITGRFAWNGIPDSLQIPSNVGTLALSVGGSKVPFPKREANGLVWLKQSAAAEENGERLELSVHRRIDDHVPLVITTRVLVSASGNPREVVLPQVLIPRTRPVALLADLPAQLSPDGALRVQTQAGDYRVEIVAIRETPESDLVAPSAPAPWPEHEYWVWKADDQLRHAEIHGAPQIDPGRTDLAEDWRHLPTYVVAQKQTITIETRRRGEPEPPPNQLTVRRSLWLDLDGDGYTVRDEISGAMSRNFRLDLLQGELGHVSVNGNDEVVTRYKEHSGVELRTGALSIASEWRLPHALGRLPAVAYSEDVDSLTAELHLPPGFMLLGGEGVDSLPGTWIDGWDLFDFFFVLLLSLAVAKLAGPVFFVVALLALVLCHEQPGAPEIAWVFVLATTALVRVIKHERWSKVAQTGWLAALAILLIIEIPFAVNQMRKALYPHLDESGSEMFVASRMAALVEQEGAPAAMAPEAPMPEPAQEESGAGGAVQGNEADMAQQAAPMPRRGREEAKSKSLDYGLGSLSRQSAYDKSEVDPNAVVQTGPGVPTWEFRRFSLGWSGPVERTQELTLYILPPLASRLWSLFSVLLSGLLLVVLARAAKRPTAHSVPPPAATGSLLALLVLALPALSHAQDGPVPPNDILQSLRERLLRPAACEPNCVSVPELALIAQDSRLTLRARVDAGASTAYQAPGPLDNWTPDTLRVDGKDAFGAARFDDGFLYLRLPQGQHTVELSGPLPPSQALTLALGTAPHRVTVDAKGFTVEGLRADGRAEGSIALRREVQLEPGHEASDQALAEWLEVTRELDLGVRFRVLTKVRRFGPAGRSDRDGMIVRLPLLPGESVTEAGLVSEQGSVVIELPRDRDEVSFSSTLAPRKEIELTAAKPTDREGGPVVRPWSETWIVRPSTLYHTTLLGLSPISQLREGVYRPEYKPWPGESLTIEAERLEGAQGASVTIDRAELSFTPGARMEQSTLSLHVRTSRGTTERIALPKDATLVSLTVDGSARTARIKQGSLELHLDPGSHDVTVALLRSQGLSTWYGPPVAKLARPLANVSSIVHVPADRWLLWASGPSWGPAVLFWGYLVVVLLSAWVLSRVPHSPLRTHEWMLLGLGLTQVEVPLTLIVIGWLFALSYRERAPIASRRLFNVAQVALVGLTVLALTCLAFAVHHGLVVQPDMQVQGAGSSNQLLRWYTDRTSGAFPSVSVLSAPLWLYKGLMLVWALWLAASLLRWLRWGFTAFRSGGGWRAKPPKRENPRVPLAQIAEAESRLRETTPEVPSVPKPTKPDEGA